MVRRKYELFFAFSILVLEVLAKDEKSSLTFVIDNTASMGDDIDEVKVNANAIFDTVLKSNESQIENFVLVTFNDPIIQLRTITKKRKVFKKALSEIYLIPPNGDCEEFSMSGIIEGIDHSLPRSTIYVFTDASAKDYAKYPDLKSLAIKKQAQVVFVLTGDCGDSISSPLYRVYIDLAKVTSGHVFRLSEKADVGDVIKFVEYNIQSRQSSILQEDVPPGNQCVAVTLDSKTSNRISIFSGERAKYEIKGPDGKIVHTKTILKKDYLAIAEISNYLSGVFTICIDSPYGVNLAVTAKSEVKFEYGFSTFKPSSLKETATRPLPDLQSFITIDLTEGDLEVKTIRIVDISGKTDKVVKEIPVAVLDKAQKLFITEPQDFPALFKLVITGFDTGSKTNITRSTSSIEIQPRKTVPPKAPEVFILGNASINVEFNEPVQLKCRVMGYPKPEVIWVNKESGKVVPAKLQILEFDELMGTLDIEKIDANATYECKAVNPSGSHFETVSVLTTPKPHLIMLTKERDKNIEYHTEGKIYCKVDAYPPATITWYKLRDRKPVLENDNLKFLENNSVLRIRKMHPSDDGSYLCEARNAHSRVIHRTKVTITGVEVPVIDKSALVLEKRGGSNVVLSCKILKGKPKPSIVWSSKNASGEFQDIYPWQDKEIITINDISKDYTGTYNCKAQNEIGSDVYEFDLVVEYPSHIQKKDRDEEKYIKKGDSEVLRCDVDRTPPVPEVTWFKDGVPMTKIAKTRFFRDHSVKIYSVDIEDSGTYTCNASNKLGNDSKAVTVYVYDPVTINVPNITRFDTKVGANLRLSCEAKGYPVPETRWIYYSFNPNIPPKLLKKSLGSSTLELKYIQIHQEGYYTCEASNFLNSTNLTFEAHVNARPVIQNIYVDKTFRAVEGDLVTIIKCEASGNPPPTIRWSKDLQWIVPGGSNMFIENGTLIIKDIKQTDTGTYICEAENALGSVQEVYEVKVNDYPWRDNPTTNILIGEGFDKAINCDVPYTILDRLRWYKNGMLFHVGELTIINAKVADSGVYTCRVSDPTRSISGHNVNVTVGTIPSFVTDVDESDIDYVEGNLAQLNCDAYADPEPEVTWWHNGDLLNVTGPFYDFYMELGLQGEYQCEARNEFGYIERTYNIISRDCLLNVAKKPSKLQSLMLSPKIDWPQNEVKNGFMLISKGEYLYFFCPNSRFKKFPRPYVQAFCDGGSSFKVSGDIYEFSDLECTEEITPVIERTSESCANTGTTEMVTINFNVMSETVEAYSVCLDTDIERPVYTKLRMRSAMADVDYSKTKWTEDDGIFLNFDEGYDCSRQINTISRTLGRWFHKYDGCCFDRRQLVSPKDLMAGVAQKTAYNYLNVVPHWSTCNNKSNNWDEVEQRVRTLAKSTYTDLLVWTGVAGDLGLVDTTGVNQNVVIKDADDFSQSVPTYLWKVVQNPADRSSLAIIQVNVPDLTLSQAASYVRCRNRCSDTEWMTGTDWHDVTRGYTYCCSLIDFETRFGFSGIFEPHYKLLKDVSLIPDFSLT